MTDASSTNDEATTKKKTLPMECLQRLQRFDEALTALEVALRPVLSVGFEEHMKRSGLGLVQVDVMSMFVMNSLGWCLVAQRGRDPRDNVQLADELRRTKQYVTRLKSIETRKSAPGLNKQVAKAFVRNALWEVPSKRSRYENDTPEEDISIEEEHSDSSDLEEGALVAPAIVEGPSYTVANIRFEDFEQPQRPAKLITGRRKK
ncbi:hypothetical protein KIN20_006941 [Parelaphostrongylus tenuis]|uniref:Nuclear nucleic acid-binding protein C1D n=1 Tax=Parelaphostrongylus tenuis TaxID=148309 RepID=A0AAD5QIR4_PARTN|nr:hypothetical protein KIN20_006941 [Parelaphostrongylus tenuis]